MYLSSLIDKRIFLLCVCFWIFGTSLFAQKPNTDEKKSSKKIKLFIKAEKSISVGNIEEGIRQLQNCISAGEKEAEAKALLSAVYASKSADISQGRAIDKLSLDEVALLEQNYIKILSLTTANDDDWLRCFQLLLFEKKQGEMALIAQSFLAKLRKQPDKIFNDEWLKILSELELAYKDIEFILLRYQVLKILEKNGNDTDEDKVRIQNLVKTIKSKLKYFFDQIDVAIVLGELSRAKMLLAQIEYFAPEHYLLPKIKKRLKLVYRIQKALRRARTAMHNKKFALATKFCEKVFKLDANNMFAQNILKNISAMKAIPVKSISSKNRFKLKLRRLSAELKKSEKTQHLLNIRRILKELIFTGGGIEYSERLKQVNFEIRKSRVEADERFKIAKKLFADSNWQELYFFLNRNPGLMSSLKRLVTIWEMRLMSNYYLKKVEIAEIKASAERIVAKDKQSFYANLVLMKLLLANYKYDSAREFYLLASEKNSRHPELRLPGWILWVHGDGKPWAIGFVIIFLLGLIKLIKPAFVLFESTYWFRIKMIGVLFPSLALRSLEKCFSLVSGDEQHIELFQKLISYSQRLKNHKKSIRYAEKIIAISPDHTDAIAIIANANIKQPNLVISKLQLIIKHAMNNKGDIELQSKVGQLIKNSGAVTLNQIDFLTHYVKSFDDDTNMLDLIGKSFLSLVAFDVPDSAINLLEIAWQKTDSDELWWSLWRLLMQAGKFDKAQAILEFALEKGKAIEVEKLFQIFEQEVMSEVLTVKSMLGVMDQKSVLKALAEIPDIRYLNVAMVQEFTLLLQNLTLEDDHDIKFAARKALDHIKFQLKRSQMAHDKMIRLQEKEAEPILEQLAEPFENFGNIDQSSEVVSDNFVEEKGKKGAVKSVLDSVAEVSVEKNIDIIEKIDIVEREGCDLEIEEEEVNTIELGNEVESSLFTDLKEYGTSPDNVNDKYDDTPVNSHLFDDL